MAFYDERGGGEWEGGDQEGGESGHTIWMNGRVQEE